MSQPRVGIRREIEVVGKYVFRRLEFLELHQKAFGAHPRVKGVEGLHDDRLLRRQERVRQRRHSEVDKSRFEVRTARAADWSFHACVDVRARYLSICFSQRAVAFTPDAQPRYHSAVQAIASSRASRGRQPSFMRAFEESIRKVIASCGLGPGEEVHRAPSPQCRLKIPTTFSTLSESVS